MEKTRHFRPYFTFFIMVLVVLYYGLPIENFKIKPTTYKAMVLIYVKTSVRKITINLQKPNNQTDFAQTAQHNVIYAINKSNQPSEPAVQCDNCNNWKHNKCSGIKSEEYKEL